MDNATTRLTARSRAVLAAAVCACLLAGLAVTAMPDHAASAQFRVIVLGRTAATPRPLCPGKYEDQQQGDGTVVSAAIVPCLTEGHVTGFQMQAGGVKQPFRAPFNGKIVAWSISLGKPGRRSTQRHPDKRGFYEINELGFFNSLLGKPATARIGILREIQRAKRKTFKMVRQSPTEVLNPYFGTTPQFVLAHPLTIVRNQIVALTIPTWAPMFATTASSRDTWRGSRVNPRCRSRADISGGHPQQKIGSDRVYTCTYARARLLYTATLVKKPGR